MATQDPAKQALRTRLLLARAAIPAATRRAESQRAAQHLMASPLLTGLRTIAVYAPRPEEADPSPLFVAGPALAFPRVVGAELEFVACGPEDLRSAPPWGILEPPPSLPALPLEAIDLFIVPGVGFGPAGERIGYGRGYYDRALTQAKARRKEVKAIGFGLPCQETAGIPMGPRDLRLDGLVTAHGLVIFGP